MDDLTAHSRHQRVLIVGLGTIAKVHIDVLSRRRDTQIVGGVDPIGGEMPFPTFRSLDAALAVGVQPDLVVVATPTSTHLDIVREALVATSALVLSEKPLLTSVEEMTRLEPYVHRVRVAHHFAFSPEVEWAGRYVAARGWGSPERILSVFNDAYGAAVDSRLASLGSTWIDSAPNQLSLLAPFLGTCAVDSHDDGGVRACTVLRHAAGTVTLTSNWLAADSSKQTELDYGGHRVRLDHTSMTAVVTEGDRPIEHVGYVGELGRKEAHYAGLYDVLFNDPDDVRLSVPLAAEIARVLADAPMAPKARTTFGAIEA